MPNPNLGRKRRLFSRARAAFVDSFIVGEWKSARQGFIILLVMWYLVRSNQQIHIEISLVSIEEERLFRDSDHALVASVTNTNHFGVTSHE